MANRRQIEELGKKIYDATMLVESFPDVGLEGAETAKTRRLDRLRIAAEFNASALKGTQ